MPAWCLHLLLLLLLELAGLHLYAVAAAAQPVSCACQQLVACPWLQCCLQWFGRYASLCLAVCAPCE